MARSIILNQEPTRLLRSHVVFVAEVGRDKEMGYFWGQLKTGGSVVLNTGLHERPDGAWAEIERYLDGLAS